MKMKLGMIWERFGTSLENLWKRLGIRFERIWERFGIIYLNLKMQTNIIGKFVEI